MKRPTTTPARSTGLPTTSAPSLRACRGCTPRAITPTSRAPPRSTAARPTGTTSSPRLALTSICANIDRGGHTYELLQILDDDGQLVGFVGVETSLLGQHTGGSIITHFTALPHVPWRRRSGRCAGAAARARRRPAEAAPATSQRERGPPRAPMRHSPRGGRGARSPAASARRGRWWGARRPTAGPRGRVPGPARARRASRGRRRG